MACSVVNIEIGGKTPKESADRKTTAFGWPALPASITLSMKSTG